MAGVLKHADIGRLKPLTLGESATEAEQAAVVEPSAEALKIAELEDALDAAKSKLKARIEDEEAWKLQTRDEIRAELEAQSNREHKARVDALKETAGAALESLSGPLAALGDMAPALAHHALEPVLGKDPAVTKTVEKAIAHQLKRFKEELGVRLIVSAKDFADPGALRTALDLTDSRLEPELSSDLKSGDFQLELEMGDAVFDLADYWDGLTRALIKPAEGRA